MAIDERAWTRVHPDAQVTVAGDELTLWNYPVNRAELAPEHQAAIRRFSGPALLGPELTVAEFSVRGHASASGESENNVELSRKRAEGVGSFLRSLGFRSVDVSWAGFAEPADPSPSGQAFARNRRSVLTKFVPPLGEGGTPVPLDLGQAEPVAPRRDQAFETPDLSASFEVPLPLDLGTLETPYLVVDIKLDGKLKLKVTGKKGSVGATAVLKPGGGIGVKLEEKLKGDFKAKLGVEPGSDGKPPTIKLGIEAEKWFLKPEVGVKSSRSSPTSA